MADRELDIIYTNSNHPRTQQHILSLHMARDSCQSSNCIRQNSKQKLHRSSDIPLNIAPVESGEGVKVTSSGINIIWNDMHRVLN